MNRSNDEEAVESLADLIAPRWDPEIEEALVGSLLDKPEEVWPIVAGKVLPEDFHDPRLAKVWKVMVSLLDKGNAINIESVTGALRDAGAAAAVGAPRYLHELAARAATSVWAEQWVADLLRSAAVRRVQRASLNTLRASVCGTYDDVTREAALIEKALSERATVPDAASMRELMGGLLERIERGNRLGSSGRSTGFHALDKILGGLFDGQLLIIAARPAMGKTSMAIAIMLSVARDLRSRNESGACLFISLEMPRDEINQRAVAQVARVSEQAFRRPAEISLEDRANIDTALAASHDLPIYIQDTAEWIEDIRALLHRTRMKFGVLRVVVIDYLQLVRARMERRDSTREQEVTLISKTLKKLAKEFSVPILALAQLNRDCEKRPNKRPLLSDLRESGSLEQDADVVMFIYRDEVYRPNTEDKGIAEIIVAKQRQGGTGTVRLAFEKEFTRFDDLGGVEVAFEGDS